MKSLKSDETQNDFTAYAKNLYEPELRHYHTVMSLAKLADLTLYQNGGLAHLNGLKLEWQRTNQPESPDLIIIQINQLVEQLVSRLGDLQKNSYPPVLLNGLIKGTWGLYSRLYNFY